ncbi:hypothetical protein AAMO2058_001518700 [Amorphochlora amoebiformis]
MEVVNEDWESHLWRLFRLTESLCDSYHCLETIDSTMFSVTCPNPQDAARIITQIREITGDRLIKRVITVNPKAYPSLQLCLRSLKPRFVQFRAKLTLRRAEKRRRRQSRGQSRENSEKLRRDFGEIPVKIRRNFSEISPGLRDRLDVLRVKVMGYPPGILNKASLMVKSRFNDTRVTSTNNTHVLTTAYINKSFYASIFPNHLAATFIVSNSTSRSDKSKIDLSSPPSRSYYKLHEAFTRSKILRNFPDLSGTTAIDLGASPGGWSLYLTQRGCKRVYSIDVGDIKLIKTSPNLKDVIVHIPLHMPSAVDKLQAHMKADGVSGVNIIVCDMNVRAKESVQAIVLLESMASPGGHVVVTLKDFPEKNSRRFEDENESRDSEEYRPSFEAEVGVWVRRLMRMAAQMEVFHLATGTENERTVILKLKH